MNRRLVDVAVALSTGLIFGVGLAVSGMTQPEKVLAFLDVAGEWDGSLVLVMAGAIGVHAFAYRLIRGRKSPLFAAKVAFPSRRDIDVKLLAGAALFGVGWGVGGFCPGPGLVALGTGAIGAAVFISSMLLGTLLTAKVEAGVRDAQPNAER